MNKDAIGNPNWQLIKIQHSLHEGVKPVFSSQPQIKKIELRPDPTIKRGLFKRHLLVDTLWLAHPSTIKAVRKDIFMGGEEFEELEILIQCQSCKEILDIQFWNFCPFCESSFPNDPEIIKSPK